MLQVRNISIGSGIPKICVPLASNTLDKLIAEAKAAKGSKADLVEWRVDYYDEPGEILNSLHALREALEDMPLLFTLRSARDGGMREIGKDEYLRINREAALTGYADLIDIELFSGDDVCSDIIAAAHEGKAVSVISSHDFNGTPSKDELLARMRKALLLGGDIPKLAVTPRTTADVLTLLSAGEEFSSENQECPAIMISMGQLGKISRIAGGFFGSSITFAVLETATAPGQLAANDLRNILQTLYS